MVTTNAFVQHTDAFQSSFFHFVWTPPFLPHFFLIAFLYLGPKKRIDNPGLPASVFPLKVMFILLALLLLALFNQPFLAFSHNPVDNLIHYPFIIAHSKNITLFQRLLQNSVEHSNTSIWPCKVSELLTKLNNEIFKYICIYIKMFF